MESTSFSLALVDWIDICDLLHKVWPHLCEFEKNGNAAKFLWVTKKTCKKRAKRVDLVPKMDFLDNFYPHICYLTYSIPPHIRHGFPRTVLRISRLRVRAAPGALIYIGYEVVGRRIWWFLPSTYFAKRWVGCRSHLKRLRSGDGWKLVFHQSYLRPFLLRSRKLNDLPKITGQVAPTVIRKSKWFQRWLTCIDYLILLYKM